MTHFRVLGSRKRSKPAEIMTQHQMTVNSPQWLHLPHTRTHTHTHSHTHTHTITHTHTHTHTHSHLFLPAHRDSDGFHKIHQGRGERTFRGLGLYKISQDGPE